MGEPWCPQAGQGVEGEAGLPVAAWGSGIPPKGQEGERSQGWAGQGEQGPGGARGGGKAQGLQPGWAQASEGRGRCGAGRGQDRAGWAWAVGWRGAGVRVQGQRVVWGGGWCCCGLC